MSFSFPIPKLKWGWHGYRILEGVALMKRPATAQLGELQQKWYLSILVLARITLGCAVHAQD